MGYKFVDITENDTGDALMSEMLSIPLLMRGESSTVLVKEPKFTPSLTRPRTTSEVLGLPVLVKSDKPRATLMKGTIFSRLGLPELLK